MKRSIRQRQSVKDKYQRENKGINLQKVINELKCISKNGTREGK